MKKIQILIIVILTFGQNYSQNIIKNPSFEDRIIPYTYGTDWSSVNDWGKGTLTGSPDYHHVDAGIGSSLSAIDSSPSCGNGTGCGTTFDAEGLLGLYSADNETSEWIQGFLEAPLIVGECYKVSFAIRTPSNYTYGNNWGLLFSVDSLSYTPYPFVPGHPLYNATDAANWPINNGDPFSFSDIDYTDKNINEYVSDSNMTVNNEWEILEFYFTANGAYEYVYPGRHGLNGSYETIGYGSGLGSYVWIDSLYLEHIVYSVDPVIDITSCVDVILPQISGINLTGNEAYYTEPNGQGLMYSEGDVISENIQLYLYGSLPNTDCIYEYPFMVTVVVPELDAGNDIIVCEGEEILLQASHNADDVSWSNQVIDGISFVPNQSDIYVATTVTNGCIKHDSLNVFVNSIPYISLGEDIDIFLGETVTLKSNLAYSYLWNTNETSQEIIVKPEVTTEYFVLIENSFGCTNMDSIVINVKEKIIDTELLIPDAFSPNNDGLNDYFRIHELEKFKLEKFNIYNRWGDLIFEINEDIFQWDGKYKEEPQKEGIYYYFLTVKDRKSKKISNVSGTVSLIR